MSPTCSSCGVTYGEGESEFCPHRAAGEDSGEFLMTWRLRCEARLIGCVGWSPSKGQIRGLLGSTRLVTTSACSSNPIAPFLMLSFLTTSTAF